MFVLLIFVLSLVICCDARHDCYEYDSKLAPPGFCEIAAVVEFNAESTDSTPEKRERSRSILIACFKKQQDERRKCDSKSEYWPLPRNFNRPGSDD